MRPQAFKIGFNEHTGNMQNFVTKMLKIFGAGGMRPQAFKIRRP